jgi:hypothetical protein
MTTTGQRGYGPAHRRARRAALATHQDGTPCHLCGLPMSRDQALDLDHDPGTTTYRGLAHAHCNRADGGRRGNRMRGALRHGYPPVIANASRDW